MTLDESPGNPPRDLPRPGTPEEHKQRKRSEERKKRRLTLQAAADAGLIVRSRGQIAELFEALVAAVPADKKAAQHVEMEWALRNSMSELRLGVIDPATVPSRVALRLARIAAAGDDNFWNMYQRIMPTKQQIDRMAERDDGSVSDAELMARLPKFKGQLLFGERVA